MTRKILMQNGNTAEVIKWDDEILFETDAEPTDVVIREDEDADTEPVDDADPGAVDEDAEPADGLKGPGDDAKDEPEGDEEEPEGEEPTEAEPAADANLAEAVVGQHLTSKKVHPAIAKRLSGQRFASIEEVDAAVKAELDYLKGVTGSGKPFAMGETETPSASGPDVIAERDRKVDEINSRYLGTPVPGTDVQE